MEQILSKDNLNAAYLQVVRNKGAAGVDGMTVEELGVYLSENGESIREQLRTRKYKPQPVRRVEIPKPDGGVRNLGVPTVVDRFVQQAVAQVLTPIFEEQFHDHSYGFRPNRCAQQAVLKALEMMNDGHSWIVDIDLAKFFDTVDHDKLMTIFGRIIKDGDVISVVRKFLVSGVMIDDEYEDTIVGTPQGGPLLPVLSNIYLDKLDKELEARGLAFVRYADDFVIFTRSHKSAERVMKSVTGWIERKLFLKVSPTKTHIVPPSKSEFLGFGFWKNGSEWKCKPLASRKSRLWDKLRAVTCRRKAAAIPLSVTLNKVNEIMRGWINYYRIGNMKGFMDLTGQWIRHRIRVIMVKQWKKPKTIQKNLRWYCAVFHFNFSDEDLYKVANSRKGLYAQCNGDVINYILSPNVLGTKLTIGKGRNSRTVYPGLVNPLAYYLGTT